VSIRGNDQFQNNVTTGTNKLFGIKIYRIGYYQGNGARLVADLGTAFTGITQAACNFDAVTGLTEGNWTTTTSWAVLPRLSLEFMLPNSLVLLLVVVAQVILCLSCG
jgi:hypothetical protein